MVDAGDRKVWAFGEDAQKKIEKGLEQGAKVVGSTLGPAGRNVIIERKHRTPIITNDGLTAINNLILDDELENLGSNSLVDAANHASELAGDGTSTCIVLVNAIYKSGRERIGGDNPLVMSGSPAMKVMKDIHAEKELVIKELKNLSREVKDKEEIKRVALAATENPEMAETIADLIEKVGVHGTIIVEEGWGRDTEVELVSGMRFAGKMASEYFANTAERDLNVENLPILVTDFDFVGIESLLKIHGEVYKKGEQGLIIIGNKFERPAIDSSIMANIANAKQGNPFKVYLVRTPSFTPGEFQDFATYVGATYFSKELGSKVEAAALEDLGRASSIRITRVGDGIALGGQGSKEECNKRIEILKAELKSEKVKMIKGRLEQRIASLAAAIAIIKVASPSDAETEYLRLKTRNGVKSAQAAVAEGIVPGGGMALSKIADKLGKKSILYEALKTPNNIIKENAGGELEIPKDLYDPVKITRTAVEQAASQAGLLLTTGTAIAFKSERAFEDGARMIADKMKNEG